MKMKKERYWWQYETVLGKIFLGEADGAIVGVSLEQFAGQGWQPRKTSLLSKTGRQLEEYLAGERKDFDLLLRLEGTAWQKRVWAVLREIPYGEKWSYKMVAEKLGNVQAVRAVGGANNKNPVPILVACHRVVGADGSLVGYGWGLAIKDRLLKLEEKWRGR